MSIGRRQADTLIEQKRVLIDGKIPQLGTQLQPEKHRIIVNGQELKRQSKVAFTYLLFNKPTGYVCSRRQQGDTPTIYSLLPKDYQHLKAVGRLDKDSSGLLLLTNDGDFAHHMTHPSFGKIKQYHIQLDKPLTRLHWQLIDEQGAQLPDGRSKLRLRPLIKHDSTKWLVTMHEGRNRQIRRTFAALGYTVTKLHRVSFGIYQLKALQPGELEAVEVPPKDI